MTLQAMSRSVYALTAFALIPSALAVSVPKEQLEMEREGVQLIRQVEEVGRDVRYHAGRLNSFANSVKITRWSHAHHLEQVKSLVNEGLRPALARLEQIQPHLPEWKQQSIQKMLASATALAADASDAILTKNESGSMPPATNAAYKTLVARVYEHAEELVKTSDAAGTYAAARLKAHEAGVGVPQS